MRIAFEVAYYAPGARGPYLFGRNVVRAIGAASARDRFFVFDYFYKNFEAYAAQYAPLASSNVAIDLRRWPRRLVDLAEKRWGLPFIDRFYLAPRGIDVFCHGSPFRVDARRTASVLYVHGVPIEYFSRMQPYFERVMVPAMSRATRLVAPSICVRDLLLKRYGLDPGRISVVHYGVDHSLFRPIKDGGVLEAVRGRWRLPERFILCVGPFQFRDNIEHVLLALLDARLKGVHLVLAGGLEEHGSALVGRARALGLLDRVHFPGHVPHADLAALYNMADVFVHPSYYEELGAQNIEAAACGAPMLVSNAAGIPEAAGDAAAYFNPHRIDEFAAALLRVLENPALREEMGGRSLEWSRRFSWEESARQLVDVFHAAGRASSNL